MAIEVDQDSLRQAAAALALLPSDLDSVPELDAERCGQSPSGSTIGAALMRANPASTRAKKLLKARFNQLSGLMAMSANSFQGSDDEAARRIAEAGDINSGDPYAVQ